MTRLWSAGIFVLAVLVAPVARAQSEATEAALDAVLAAPSQARMERQVDLLLSDISVAELVDVFVGDGDDVERRALAAWVLGELAAPEACVALAQSTVEAPPAFSMAVDMAAARCGDTQRLRLRLADDDPVLRVRAAVMLALFEDEGARDQVLGLALDAELAPWAAFVALAEGLYREPSASDTLVAMLSDRSARALAAIALARLGDESVVFDLGFALGDPDPIIREYAVRAVIALRPALGPELLTRASSDRVPRISALAERAARIYNHMR